MSDTLNNALSLPERLGLNSDQFKQFWKQARAKLRVCLPGVIQSFNATLQTAVVQVAVLEKTNQNINGALVAQDQDIKLLNDVPVLVLQGSTVALTMPVAAGDECLLIIADYCIDAWWQAGGTGNAQLTKRRHDISDAFAIVGPNSKPTALASYSTTAAELRTVDNSVKVSVGAAGVEVTGKVGFYGTAPIAKPVVTGSKGGNAALTSLLVALANMGLITNSTT